MNTITFPHLGFTVSVDPVAFTVFGLEIKWYGLILTVGILAAFLLLRYNAIRRERIQEDHIYNLALLTVPLSIVGARFAYVATSWEEYRGDLWKILNIRGGGLAVYGGVIFGAIAILLYSRIKKLSTLRLLDAVAPGLMLAQVIGRWGNFVNMEAFGEYTDNFLAMRLPLDGVHWSDVTETMLANKTVIDGVSYIQVHPTFLYESLWNLVGVLFLLLLFYPKKKFDGEIICLYLGWYGLGRTWIELLRTDSLYLFGNVKFSVVVGVLSVLICAIGMPLLYRKSKRSAVSEAYTAKFRSAAVETVSEQASDSDGENDEQSL